MKWLRFSLTETGVMMGHGREYVSARHKPFILEISIAGRMGDNMSFIDLFSPELSPCPVGATRAPLGLSYINKMLGHVNRAAVSSVEHSVSLQLN